MRKTIYIIIAILTLISSLIISVMTLLNIIQMAQIGTLSLLDLGIIGYFMLLILPIIPIYSFFKQNNLLFIANILILIITGFIIITEILSRMQEQQLF